MKKKTKILLSLIIVFSILISVFAGIYYNALAQTGGDSGSLKWSLNDDGVFTVNGVGYGDNYTTLNMPWRSNRSQIKTVIVEEGVQAIGDNWFYGSSNITSVELPDSLVKIGAACFRGCSSLENITIPENCCEFYDNTFYNCTSLKWAVLPRDNTPSSHKIPDSTFYGCSNLENVWVGSDYTSIGANTFRNCNKLSAVIWTGSTISSIGSNFPSGANLVGTSAIQSWCNSNGKNFINISGSCGSSLNYSYSLNDKKLTLSGSGAMQSAPWNNWRYFVYSVDFGGATSICENAFYGCEYLTGELDLPGAVTSIGTGAFDGAGYEAYTINAVSVSIASGAFGGNDNLVFYGNHGSGAYDYVQSARVDHPEWRFYCIRNHVFGSNDKCVYCDKTRTSQILEPCGNHEYIYQYRLGSKLYYKCAECEAADYCVNARDLLLDFSLAASSKGTPYNQPNYDGRFDILRDGYINGKDYKLILDIRNGRPTEVDMNLTNENATPEAKELFRYITSVYKNKIISGQQESTWMGSPDYEMNYIYNKTGKYPAIRGLDFMNDDFSGVVSRAKAWHNRGGIVTICWHCSSKFDGSFNESQADELTPAQWDAIFTTGSSENIAFLNAMDKAANALLELQSEGIPVLWRPFHEFDGGWFWWGKGGSENFKKLWKMMYNHFTYDKGLNNLIWVLGYSHNGTDYGTNLADWYPGNRYCDISGADSYEVSQNGAEARLYNPVSKVVNSSKPLVMHETGQIPTVEQFQGVPWGYFMTWHTNYLTDENSVANLNAIYNSDYVITLDEITSEE